MEVSSIKGTRTHISSTFNPTIARPGEKIYVHMPKLNPNHVIIPNTMFLAFKFKNTNTKSRFLNNLSRLLIEQLQIQFADRVVYDNIGESTIELYKDKWLADSERNNMKIFGIADLNVRKLMSNDDSGSDSNTTNGVNDKLIADGYTDFYLRVGKILNEFGLFTPNGLKYGISYTLTLPEASEIMEAQSSQSVDSYELTHLRLEYQTIDNKELAMSRFNAFNGVSLTFEDCSLQTTQCT